MNAQTPVIVLVVLWSLVFATWQLMPGSLRQRLAAQLVRQRWLARWSVLRKAAVPTGGGGCGGCRGCGSASAKPSVPAAPQTAVIHFTNRRSRQ
jgi:hypothetical protein